MTLNLLKKAEKNHVFKNVIEHAQRFARDPKNAQHLQDLARHERAGYKHGFANGARDMLKKIFKSSHHWEEEGMLTHRNFSAAPFI